MSDDSSEKHLEIRLVSRPEGLPKTSDFELVHQAIHPPGDGEVMVENVYLSLDPAMRGWMEDRPSYIPPVGLGEVMRGITTGRVVESKHDDFTPGESVTGLLGWRRYATVVADQLTKLPPGVPLDLALGPLGPTGMTAYFGLLDVGEPKEGDTILVSAAAGATGSIVGQIAKIKGCRVVGLAGTDEKCRWIEEELGFDAAINYKTTKDLQADIQDACPDGLDLYFDNVGGEILNTALSLINRGARVVICGAISQYNATEPVPGPANYLALLVQRARMEGFIVLDYAKRFPEAQRAIGGWLQEGKVSWRADVVEGLENAPDALLKLFDGRNRGKLLVKVAGD